MFTRKETRDIHRHTHSGIKYIIQAYCKHNVTLQPLACNSYAVLPTVVTIMSTAVTMLNDSNAGMVSIRVAEFSSNESLPICLGFFACACYSLRTFRQNSSTDSMQIRATEVLLPDGVLKSYVHKTNNTL